MSKKSAKILKILVFPLKFLVILPIFVYKIAISPFLTHTCRFTPSCSKYATRAIKEFGIFKGLHLATKRLLRCNPKSKGGLDPVPDNIKGDIKWVL